MQDTHPSPARMIQATDITNLVSENLRHATALRDRIESLLGEHLGLGTTPRDPPPPDTPEPNGFVPLNVGRLRATEKVLGEISLALSALEESHGRSQPGGIPPEVAKAPQLRRF